MTNTDNILYSKILGNGEKHLLVFHGLFGQSDNWNTLGKKFSEYYTTHLMDLRNHGNSFHSDDMSFTAMVNDIKLYMEYHRISSAILLGHSLGGRAVMEFSFAYPEKVDKLIVVDMAPKAYQPHHQNIFKALNAVDFNSVKKRSDVEAFMKPYISQTGVLQFLLKNVHLTEEGKYAFRFNLKTLTEFYDDIVGHPLDNGSFSKQTLFLRGEKSDYILNEDAILIKKLFPNSNIETVPNAGHWIHSENPTVFLNDVLQFLND